MKRQMVKNALYNALAFIFNVGIGLALTPFLIKKMGISTYGIVPLALFFTFYMGVITQALTGAVSRFFITCFQREDYKSANEIFNTSLIITVIYVLLQGTAFFFIVLNLDSLLDIEKADVESSKILFYCVIISFSLALLSSTFSVSLYAKNRIDKMQIINILKALIKFGTIVILLNETDLKLEGVGFSFVVSELIALIMSIILWRIYTPQICISFIYFNKHRVKELILFASWLMVDQIGYVLFIKSDLFLVNRFSGPAISGKYSIATQFSDLLRSLAGLMASVLAPVIMILYSRGEQDKIKNIVYTFVKMLSMLLAIPICLICIFSQEIINIWIGKGYLEVSSLIWIVTLPLILNLGVLPLFTINIAYKKVKLPAMLNIIFALAGISMSIVLNSFTTLGYYSIAIGFTVALTIKNGFFIPLYAAHVMAVGKYTFLFSHVRTIIFSAVYLSLLFYVKHTFAYKGIYFLIELAILAMVGMILSLVFYNKAEIISILSVLKPRLSKTS